METHADVFHRGGPDTGYIADDPYDERHREANALATWERQKEAWKRMQKHLVAVTTTTTSSRSAHKGETAKKLNFNEATTTARAKREDLGLLFVARPDTTKKGSSAWESMLRCTDARLARRLVPIGRATFPYRLHGEVRDPGMLPDDHMIYARVVSEGDVMEGQNTTSDSNTVKGSSLEQIQQRAAAQARIRAMMRPSTTDVTKNGTETESAFTLSEGNVGKGVGFYYESRLRQYVPCLQERLSHFLEPRVFLQVEGHRAPYASAEELEAYNSEWCAARPSSAPGVQFYPPPPQTQMWASVPASRSPSRTASTLHPTSSARKGRDRSSITLVSVPSYSPRTRPNVNDHGRAAENDILAEEGEGVIDSVHIGSAPVVSPLENAYDASNTVLDGTGQEKGSQRSQAGLPSSLHPLRMKKDTASSRRRLSNTDAGEEEKEEQVQIPGPAVELSTRSLFFETRPHELLQGIVTLHNTGTTSIYYSLVPIDAVAEHLGLSSQDPKATAATNSGALITTAPREWKEIEANAKTQRDPDLLASASIMHTLAVHQRTARETFFFVSSPLDGVVLPGERGDFVFAVRANRTGIFQHTYELLTVPPAPLHIFIRLRALVRHDKPSWEWLAAPVAQAIDAKVVVDAQRRLVQSVSMNHTVIEQSALSAHIKALDDAAEIVKAAERTRRRTQEKAWHTANRFTFDYIPYAPAVYDKLEQLYSVVQETYRTLSKVNNIRRNAAPITSTVDKKPSVFGASVKSSASPPALMGRVSSPKKEPAQRVATGPSQWDGSLLILVQQMMLVRDARTRQLFFEAFLVLLRAARAAPPRTNHKGSTGDIDQEALPLPKLLLRAAEALADGVQSRRATLLERECENMIGKKLTAAATPFMQAFTTTSGTYSPRAAGNSADPAKLSSAGGFAERPHSNKKVVSPRSRGGGSATPAERINGASAANPAGPKITELTRAQRVILGAIPPEELLCFSAIQASSKSAAALETKELAAVHMQRELELKAERNAQVELYTAQFLDVIDAACDRGPLSTCTEARLAELQEIQTSPLLPIDPSADVTLPLTTGKTSKRK